MKTRRRSHRGAATSPARRLTGATCRGRPRHHLPAAPKCRHRGSHRRPRATRTWAQARDKQLALPEKIRRWSVPARSPAGRASPGRGVPRPAKLTPPRRSEERLALAISTMVPTAPTPTPCRGAGHERSRRTLRRRRACHRRWILAPPCGACSRYFSGAAEPHTSMSPSSPTGAKDQL
jgi:hypothetical protein